MPSQNARAGLYTLSGSRQCSPAPRKASSGVVTAASPVETIWQRVPPSIAATTFSSAWCVGLPMVPYTRACSSRCVAARRRPAMSA